MNQRFLTGKEARVRDLIAARSGVYHGAAYATPARTPGGRPRQSRARHLWFYNNWDFNAAELISSRSPRISRASTDASQADR
jgi:hypothetical protein